MSYDFTWPSPEPLIEENVLGTNISLMKEKFGALSQDEDIYSRICIGNSVISLEPYKGCPLGCAYCMANNDIRSLNNYSSNSDVENVILKKPQKIYDSLELLDALIGHPAFIKDKTIIGFCTGSTEVFLPEVGDNVWYAMKQMVDLNLKNPIWLVVKSFWETERNKWIKRFEYLIRHGIKVIISITDSGMPKDIEPYQIENRFEPFTCLAKTGVILSHHLRPILPKKTDIRKIEKCLDLSKDIVKSVCVGGLRIDPGMKLFWDKNGDYEYIPGNQEKVIDYRIIQIVSNMAKKNGLPVFIHSSEMISYHLGIPDYNLYQYRKNTDCFLDLGELKIKNIERKNSKKIQNLLKEIAGSIRLQDLEFDSLQGKIYLNQSLKYQEYHALIQAIGHSRLID